MPWPDRSVEEWVGEIRLNLGIVARNVALAALGNTHEEDRITHYAVALKEARRTASDIYRMAEKAGFTREQIDSVRT